MILQNKKKMRTLTDSIETYPNFFDSFRFLKYRFVDKNEKQCLVHQIVTNIYILFIVSNTRYTSEMLCVNFDFNFNG